MSGGVVVWEWLLLALTVASMFIALWIGAASIIEHRKLRRAT